MRTAQCFIAVLSALCFLEGIHAGNILVWHADGSHWINLKPVLDSLIDRGHKVTILFHNVSLFVSPEEHGRYNYHLFNASISNEEMQSFFHDIVYFSMYELDRVSYAEAYFRLHKLLMRHIGLAARLCDGILRSDSLMKKLRQAKYDLLLADPLYPGSEVLAEALNLPFVYSFRFSTANCLERMCGQLPAPPSYVPGTMVRLTDQMSFSERITNFLFYLTQDASYGTMCGTLDKHYSEILGKPVTACELIGKASIWLIRTYWDFDYPHPLLPNFKYVGGIHCKPAQPLPKEMEEFVQSSGDAGVVVFTLGSMIGNLTQEKTNIIATALGKIPQKVLWRHKGNRPDSLAPNTRIYEWIPQNDLLGHPKTKAFVTHGGTNGIYEAIYHGVPMVGIPLFFDQPDNMVHMKAKGAAVILDFLSLKSQDIVDGLHTVINNPKYKAGILKLSKIFHDRPISPRDEAVFWVEYVMRHKGAEHLRVASHGLTWYQYHSLDVIAFLIGVVILILFLFIKTCMYCLRRCCGTSSFKKKRE